MRKVSFSGMNMTATIQKFMRNFLQKVQRKWQGKKEHLVCWKTVSQHPNEGDLALSNLNVGKFLVILNGSGDAPMTLLFVEL